MNSYMFVMHRGGNGRVIAWYSRLTVRYRDDLSARYITLSVRLFRRSA
jgi:hypothetical protein